MPCKRTAERLRKGGGGDVEALALAVPTDALSEPAPEDLVSLESGAMDAYDAAGSKDWQTAWAIVEEMKAAAEIVVEGSVPDRLGPQLDAALRELAAAVRKQDAAAARQAAIDVARWSLDLQLRHRPVAEVELARFDLWAAQMLVDVEARNVAGVNGDFFSLDYIRDRVQQTLSEEDLARLNLLLEELNGAVGDADLPTVARGARELRDMVAGFSA